VKLVNWIKATRLLFGDLMIPPSKLDRDTSLHWISIFPGFTHPSEEDMVSVLHQDGVNLLHGNLLSNHLLYPNRFDLEEVAHAIEDFMTGDARSNRLHLMSCQDA